MEPMGRGLRANVQKAAPCRATKLSGSSFALKSWSCMAQYEPHENVEGSEVA